jgi:hypothetical protein
MLRSLYKRRTYYCDFPQEDYKANALIQLCWSRRKGSPIGYYVYVFDASDLAL